MKIVFDTNVLISSTLWKNSVSRKLVDNLFTQNAHIFTSPEILDEYCKVLQRDFNLSKEEIEEKSQFVLSFTNVVNPLVHIDAIKEDLTDNKILECAVETNSEFILSYDNHLLKLKEFQGIKILTPEKFLNLIG